MCRWKDSRDTDPRAHLYTFSSTPPPLPPRPVSDDANLSIQLHYWRVEDALDMLSGLSPLFPDPLGVKERHAQRVTTLISVEELD